MNNEIQYAILKILISSSDYISAQKIAEMLQVSRRTIFNNMKEVKEICDTYGAKLISSKSKGYKIEEYSQIFKFLEEQNYEYVKLTNYECKLYIIYLLLVEDLPIRISEIESIVYLSRPTIYKMMDEIIEWFNQFGVKVNLTRNGIDIVWGERRYRDSLKNWILEVKKYVEDNLEKKQDYFKLSKSYQSFFIKDYYLVYDTVVQICEEFKIHCSNFELVKATILLEIVMYRNQNNHYTALSKRFYNLICSIYTLDKIEKIQLLINHHLNFVINLEEAIYFISTLMTEGNLSDRDLLNNRLNDIKINHNLLEDIKDYLISRLKLSDDGMNELMDEITYIIKREILFQIKGSAGVSAKHYRTLLNNYKITVAIASELFKKISSYYHMKYHEKTICNLAFALLEIIQKNKRNLRIVLYHDCDVFEYRYVLLNLEKLPYISLVFTTDSEENLNDYLKNNKIDLIFSTCDYEHVSIETVIFSKMFTNEEVGETIKKLNKMYEVANYLEIIKN